MSVQYEDGLCVTSNVIFVAYLVMYSLFILY